MPSVKTKISQHIHACQSLHRLHMSEGPFSLKVANFHEVKCYLTGCKKKNLPSVESFVIDELHVRKS